MKAVRKLVLATLLTTGAVTANANLHVYSFTFDDSVTVRVFDNGAPVSEGTVTVYNSDGREIKLVNVAEGKATFRFPALGPNIKIVANVGDSEGTVYQSRESRTNH